MNELMEVTLDMPSAANKSVNFGGGLELLMNDQAKDVSHSSHVGLNDVFDLDKELDSVSYGGGGGSSSGGAGILSDDLSKVEWDLGSSTAKLPKDNSSTWDGFTKVN